ncbi:MAG TPA: glycosyltransferase family 87 protein [Gemmataceae bacterium]|nr:glycosyltransferase family 87 protein [Gemmataceae bacterium]
MTLGLRARWMADRLALLALAAWVGADLLGKTVFGATPWPDSVVDYRLLYDYSRHVVAAKAYPPHYPYPPSAVVLHYASALFSFPVSAGLWMAGTAAAALGCWWVLARMLGLDRRPGLLALLLLAHAASAYFFQWDLRSQNCNLVFLAALLFGLRALQRQRPAAAGWWLALSFSLKLFSVLVIPYLLWSGRRKELGWTLAFLAVFWVGLPAALFTPEGMCRAYADWFRQMEEASNQRLNDGHPILISLRGSAERAVGDRGAAGLVENGVRGLWLAVMAGAWGASRRRADRGDIFGLLTDVSVLTLAPIALSPYLEPYHPVPFAIPALLLLHAAADRRQTWRVRLLAAGLFAASVGVALVPHGWEVRGLVVNAKLLLAVGGGVAVAWLRRPSGQAAGAGLPLPLMAHPAG